MDRILDYMVFDKKVDKIDLESVRIINTINPHSYCVSKKDKKFEMALKKSDVLLPDGIGIVYASKVLNGKRIQKIAGFDIFEFVMHTLNNQSGSCYFLGASDKTLNLIKERAKKDFPNVKVGSFSPPFKPLFSEDDNAIIIGKINDFRPDALFVGMTAPKQEKWVYENEEQLNASIICSIGAVFDFYAGTVKRSSPIWIKLGLEWLPRLLQNPKRLWRRNLISTPMFVLEVCSYKLFGRGFIR